MFESICRPRVARVNVMNQRVLNVVLHYTTLRRNQEIDSTLKANVALKNISAESKKGIYLWEKHIHTYVHVCNEGIIKIKFNKMYYTI